MVIGGHIGLENNWKPVGTGTKLRYQTDKGLKNYTAPTGFIQATTEDRSGTCLHMPRYWPFYCLGVREAHFFVVKSTAALINSAGIPSLLVNFQFVNFCVLKFESSSSSRIVFLS